MLSDKLPSHQLPATSTLLEAVAGIQRNSSRCIAIINEKRRVVGVFSEGDVMRALLRGADIHAYVQSFLSGSFVYMTSRDMAAAFDLMHQRGITFLPIVNGSFELVDVITVREVFDWAKPLIKE